MNADALAFCNVPSGDTLAFCGSSVAVWVRVIAQAHFFTNARP